MSIAEIENQLPSGFHDAFLRGIRIDYAHKQVELELEVWVGDLNSDDLALREAYRRVRLSVFGLIACGVEMPDKDPLEDNVNGLPIGLAPANTVPFPKVTHDDLMPTDAFCSSFYFAEEGNSYIHIAGTRVEIEWLSDPRLIY
jgi:hypothetical protein